MHFLIFSCELLIFLHNEVQVSISSCDRAPGIGKFLELFLVARAVQALMVIAVAAEGRTLGIAGSLHSGTQTLGALLRLVRALVHRAGTGSHHRALLARRVITGVYTDAIDSPASLPSTQLLNTVCGLALPMLQQFVMWASACGWIQLDALVDGDDATSRCDALCAALGIRTVAELLTSDLQKVAIDWLKSTRADTAARCPIVRPGATNAWRFRFIDMISKSHVYNKLFIDLQSRKCLRCNTVPTRTAVCLVCGAILCWKLPCCEPNGIRELTQHSRDCGEGRAVYLLVRPVVVLATTGLRRRCLWGSFYLDEYVGLTCGNSVIYFNKFVRADSLEQSQSRRMGESDRFMRRGRELFLSEERLHQLCMNFVDHTFVHDTRLLSDSSNIQGETW